MKTPEKKVTRPQLKIEVDTLLAEAKLKFEDLNRQDAKAALRVCHGGGRQKAARLIRSA